MVSFDHLKVVQSGRLLKRLTSAGECTNLFGCRDLKRIKESRDVWSVGGPFLVLRVGGFAGQAMLKWKTKRRLLSSELNGFFVDAQRGHEESREMVFSFLRSRLLVLARYRVPE